LTTKMLASTVQFSTNDQPTTHSTTPDPATTGGMPHQGHAWHTPETTTNRLFPQDPTGCPATSTTKNTLTPEHHQASRHPPPQWEKSAP